MNVIVDTNILVSFFDKENVNHLRADTLVEELIEISVLAHTPKLLLSEILIGTIDEDFENVKRLVDNLTIEYLDITSEDISNLKLIPKRRSVKVVDSLLLAMCITNKCKLVTFDDNLANIANTMGLLYQANS